MVRKLSFSATGSKRGLRMKKQVVVQAWETKAKDQEPGRCRNREEARSKAGRRGQTRLLP